jgi:hypothetical protein
MRLRYAPTQFNPGLLYNDGVGGKRSAIPTCIDIRIAVEDPNSYADG